MLLYLSAFSQSLQRSAFVSSGNSTSTSSLESSIGELMVDTYSNPSNILSQGFIQNDQFSVSVNFIVLEQIQGTVFPNPVTSVLNVEIVAVDNSAVIIEVVDVLGKKHFLPLKSSLFNHKYTYELNFDGLSPGIYFVKIVDPKSQFNQTYKISKI